jgi:uncharacterized repeat protein (TIGR03803 family)
MTTLNGWKKTGALLLLCAVATVSARAQIFTSLASFNGTTEGGNPNGVIQGVNGNFYGTAFYYGSYGYGVVFEMTPDGSLKTLHNFAGYPNDGGYPAGLLLVTDGSFYGTTSGGGAYGNGLCGGCGTVSKITSGGTSTVLHSFCAPPSCADGAEPFATLVQGIDGSFYGSTAFKGSNQGGTIFTISSTGGLTTLYEFCSEPNCTDGEEPSEALVLGTDGNFYGTTSLGGNTNSICDYTCGTIFKITPMGELKTLYRFCSEPNCIDGANPGGSLIQATDGNFYGTAAYGGSSSNCGLAGCGTIFKITQEGEFTIIHQFAGPPTEGFTPLAALVQATDGNLYGTTFSGGAGGGDGGEGTVFKLAHTGQLSTLYSFCSQFGCADGSNPNGLFQATDGNFYGTTFLGGQLTCDTDGEYGCGTVFNVKVGLAPFVAFVQQFGKVGQAGGILGQGFTGTTGVMLNGIPANFKVASDTFIKATVPPGATTGYVTVNTPAGVLTSNVPFRVIP